MTETKTDARRAVRQLPLYLPVAFVPRLDDATRETVVGLLARLLASASAQGVDVEAPDETR